MPERYDRSVCADELLLRNTIANKMEDGWGPADAFHLPGTVSGPVRIGKSAGDVPFPTPDGGPRTGSTPTVEILPSVNNTAPGENTQSVQSECADVDEAELSQTQLIDDSEN